jgi:hypothetical protein
MKTKMFLGALLGSALWLVPMSAQDKKVDGSNVSVTGCLAHGDEHIEYSIKDTNGKTYGLRAGSEVNLKAHLGHKVTVTGTTMKEKKETVKTGKPEESEHLRVNNLSMVSTTCS